MIFKFEICNQKSQSFTFQNNILLFFFFRVHLDDLANSVLNHPVLKSLPITADLIRRYNHVTSVLTQYQTDITEVWTHQNSWVIEECLKKLVSSSVELFQKL